MHYKGITKKNIDFICERRGCTPDRLRPFSISTNCENSYRAHMIKELTECKERTKTLNNFSEFEIEILLNAICTF